MKNIIIAGANGKLGNVLKIYFEKNFEYTLYEIDRNLKLKSFKNTPIESQKEIYKNSYIINCAGETSDTNLMLSANFDFPSQLIKIAINNKVKKFIHFSSVGSFGAKRYDGKITEYTKYKSTDNFYESSKAKFDKYIESSSYKLDISVLMPSNIIFNSNDAFVNFIRLLKVLCPKVISKDGWLNFIHVDAICETVNQILNSNLNHKKIIINCPIKYSNAAKEIADAKNFELKYLYIPNFFMNFAYNFLYVLKKVGFTKVDFFLRRIYEMDNNIYFESSYDDVCKINQRYGLPYIFRKTEI